VRKAKNRVDTVFQLGAGSCMQAGALAIAASVALVMTLAVCAPGASAQANVQGTWTTLSQQMLINPVHTALMANGKILIVSGSGNYPSQTTFQVGVWDPSTNTMTTGTQSWDQFCNGMVVFPDGRPFIVGGNLQYDPFHGWNRTTVYDPATGKYTDMEDMAHGRWYPTDTILGDGRLMTFSGLDENGGTNSTVEIYTVGAGWAAPTTAAFTPPLYPRMHLLPNGTVFYSGSTTQSRTFDPVAGTWSGVIATTNYGGQRTYGSSVLLPLTPGNNYAPKVMILGGGNPSTATTEIIDLSVASPAWVYGPNMVQPRIEMNATLLPTGKILTVGGSLNDEDTGSASLQADLYDVAGNTMGSAGSNGFARLYHSVALLLPDATVWVAGGNPTRGSFEPHVEIYTPPYLYNTNGTLATRPTITSTSRSVIGYGTSFTVTTPDAANISSVVLMKNGASTHAFDMEQRMVGLSFTKTAGALTVTGPPNGNTAPPGYYMLFLINNAGVPSVANFLQVSKAPNDIPPAGTISSPATDVTIAPGGTVTFAGTGTANTGTIASYSWSIRGGTPATSAVQNPGVVTFASPGIYEASLTVTDSGGVSDPSPPKRTITVSANAAPAVTAVAPTSALQGSTNLNVTVTGTGFFGGATCAFGSGIEVNTCTVNSATQITANIDVQSGAATGAHDVTVTNTDSQSGTLAGGFTVTAGTALPAPTLASVSPNSQFQGATGVAVVLTGTNFQPNPTCAFNKDVGGITNTCTYVSATEIDATLTIAADAELGGHNVIVTNADGQSATLINGFTATANLGPTVQLGTGFSAGALVLNGNAQLNGTSLELTDGGQDEDASAWYATPVNVTNFVTDFTFQLTPGTTADGFTFALQKNNTAALGTLGGGLGYGPVLKTDPPGILNSIAVKFDLYSNYGEGVNSTGLYVDGVSPSTPAVDMTTTPAGIDLHSGDPFAVHMVYDGTTLTMTITDTTTNAMFTNAWTIDIPTTVGGNTAYAGFTGGTGGLTATQSILTWTLGPTSPGVGFTPTGTIDFPDTVKNVTSAPISVTVKNNGTAPLHVTGVSFAGTNSGDFAAASDTCTAQTIAVNATCAVGVTFTPSGTGARAASLQIADDAAGSPQTVSLAGNGLASGTPVATITPASPVMFPSTTQGVASSPMVFTVTNSGNAVLNISTVSISGANAGDFALSMNTCNGANVAASGTCTVNVTFTPGGIGARTATFQVADNAAASPQSVALTGTGTAPAPAVTTTPVGGLTFPSTTVNVTSAAMMETITNSGNAVLNISGITLSGANPGDFAIATNSCGATLAVNASCSVSITFKPTATGARAASLAIADNASGSPQLVSIMGTGGATNAPAATITPTTVTFSATQGTNSSATTVTVTNSGNAPLHVSSVTFGGANVSDFVNPTNPCTAPIAIAPSANCTIMLTFAPVTAASTTARTETITIADDAPNSPQTVTVNGTVSASAFSLTSAASAQTATVTAGQTANYSLQLTSGAGFSGSVMWACTGAPATTTCTVTPNPVPLTSGAAATFAVNVTTTARSMQAPPSNRQPWPPASQYLLLARLLACLAMLALLYELKRRGGLTQRRLAYCGGALLLAVALYGIAGCASSGISGGGGGGTTGTQAGTYTLTLTPTATGATGKALQLSPVTLTLKVN
jgi:hypothetical protein